MDHYIQNKGEGRWINPMIGDNSLKNLTRLFARFGWDKKLGDLTEEEIKATVVIMQFSKKVEEDEQYNKKNSIDYFLNMSTAKKNQKPTVDELPF